MRPNNPAGRLLNLVERGASVQGVHAATGWATVLEVDEEDTATLLQRLSSVYRLPKEIREAVAELPDADQDLLLREMPKIETGLRTALNANWDGVIHTIDGTARYSLEVISHELSRRSSEPVLPEEQAEQLLVLVRELLDEVAAADLPPEYRTVLTRHLRAMQSSLEEVRVRGTAAIREAVEGLFGSTLIAQAEGTAPGEDTTAHRLWGKTVGFGARALMVLGLLNGAVQLGVTTYEALPLPTQTAAVAPPADGP